MPSFTLDRDSGVWHCRREISPQLSCCGGTLRFRAPEYADIRPNRAPSTNRIPNPIFASRVQYYPLRQSSAFGKVLCRFTPKNASRQAEHDLAYHGLRSCCGTSERIRPGGLGWNLASRTADSEQRYDEARNLIIKGPPDPPVRHLLLHGIQSRTTDCGSVSRFALFVPSNPSIHQSASNGHGRG